MLTFFKQWIKKWSEIWAISPCSYSSVDLAISSVNLEKCKTIVELGAGTGVFTKHIQKKIRDDQKFLSFEINPEFFKEARKNSPQTIIYNDTVENIKYYLEKHDIETCDCIISTLPWAVFPSPYQKKLIEILYSILSDKWEFVTITYFLLWSLKPSWLRFKKLLKNYFGNVSTTPVVWNNIPPAIFYYSRK